MENSDQADIPESLFSSMAFQMTLDTPWKASNEIWRLLIKPLAWWRLHSIEIGKGWMCYGLPIIQKHRRSTIRIGQRMSLRSTTASNPLGPNHPVIISTRRANASLTIGDDFGMTGGSLVVEEKLTIGHRVWIGANSILCDTDFHPLDPLLRQQNPLNDNTAPIVIEDDVFIGMNVLVLKGVTIGARTVIGAGSVVTRDIPADVIAAGNPARVIRTRE